MSIDIFRLSLILSGSVAMASIGALLARGMHQRMMLISLLLGLLIYGGIGAADIDVPTSYIGYYLVTFVSVVVGFHIGRVIFLPISKRMKHRVNPALSRLEQNDVWRWVIMFNIILSIFPLFWPELKVYRLFTISTPDLTSIAANRFEEVDSLTRIIGYIRLLLIPFFYIALFQLRNHLRMLIFILLVILYLDYTAASYIGRGTLMMNIILIILAIWLLKPQHKRLILIVVAISTPFVLYLLYAYSHIRVGGNIGNIDIYQAIEQLLKQEMSFPTVGSKIIEQGLRIDLSAYFTWMFTLPLPKLLTGPIEGARINYEISEYVLGIPMGEYGWFVVLPGLVGEAVYLFGSYIFWMHGIFIGVLAAFVCRLLERSPQLNILFIYLLLQFSYVLNRAGISAILPTLVNGLLSFYILLFLLAYRPMAFLKSRRSMPSCISIPSN